MAEGMIKQGDVVLNPRVIQEVTQKLSIMRSVSERAGIPTVGTDKIDFLKTFRTGGQGQIDETLNGVAGSTKIEKSNGEVSIKFPKYTFSIDEQAKATSISLKEEIEANTQNMVEYFASMRDYRALTKYVAAAKTTTAATALWTASTAKIEEDVSALITRLLTNTDYDPTSDAVSIVVPSAAMSGLYKLDMIGNIQQRIMDYLGGTYTINFYSYTPRKIKGTSYNDALTTTALAFISGIKTGRIFEYTPPTNTQVKMREYERIAGSADRYHFKAGVEGFAEWDGQATWTSASNYKSYRIEVLSGVTS